MLNVNINRCAYSFDLILFESQTTSTCVSACLKTRFCTELRFFHKFTLPQLLDHPCIYCVLKLQYQHKYSSSPHTTLCITSHTPITQTRLVPYRLFSHSYAVLHKYLLILFSVTCAQVKTSKQATFSFMFYCSLHMSLSLSLSPLLVMYLIVTLRCTRKV